MTFTERLRAVQRTQGSLLCVGLDTDPGKLPAHLGSADNPVVEFNKRLIDATHDLVCAYKINLAFYEALGEAGWSTIQHTLEHIPKEIITIADGKRADIGNSSERYATSLFTGMGFSSCTVAPYMGSDSLEPFFKHEERGVFVLAVTSNAGARDFQYLKVRGKPLYEHVIARVRKWNIHENCGLVVGATRPKELQRIRSLAPTMPLLIPGIGAQGGSVRSAVRHGCDKQGDLAVINASRSILYASSGADFTSAARSTAVTLRDEINSYRDVYF
jgi:orotidine-5'-phosphate decarboxylase